jgi:hypothetical protein
VVPQSAATVLSPQLVVQAPAVQLSVPPVVGHTAPHVIHDGEPLAQTVPYTNGQVQSFADEKHTASMPCQPVAVVLPSLDEPRSRTASLSVEGISSSPKSQDANPQSLLNGTALSFDLDSDDEDLSEELRKIDEDFQKNLQRAKKVFSSRMDNLQRSQIEREVQHQKTLEKHEKDRMEFEKRLAQEEEQQLRRIEQLQREWDKRRETLSLEKRRNEHGSQPANGAAASHASLSLDEGIPAVVISKPTTMGHNRNVSTASSGLSMSPATPIDHKMSRPQPDGNGYTNER